MQLHSLKESMPAFAAELVAKLTEIGEVGLAESVLILSIVELCPCGGGHCAGFYTAPPPDRAYGPGHRSVQVPSEPGYIIMDILDEQIFYIEVLERDDIRGTLLEAIARASTEERQ